MAVVLDGEQACLKPPVGIAVSMVALAPVEQRAVAVAVDGFYREAAENLFQHLLAADRVAQYLAHRHGVGRVAHEVRLVDVQSDADDALPDERPAELLFDEDAA